MEQSALLELAKQLNAMDLPFGSAFITAAIALYIFKQYLELKKQNLDIKLKYMELTNTSGLDQKENATQWSRPLSELDKQRVFSVYIAALVIAAVATILRYTFAASVEFFASMGDTFQIYLWGSHGRSFGVWAYPVLGVGLVRLVFRNQITRRDFLVATVLFTVTIPLFLTTIFVVLDGLFNS